ncbi:protein ILRUN isoform X3 [Macrotis lagotis]|uniref:protein ILRUN isoform X3 n=1 Tax=Macrotis lagotis TaxID=92651 RepID=UPI003D68328F
MEVLRVEENMMLTLQRRLSGVRQLETKHSHESPGEESIQEEKKSTERERKREIFEGDWQLGDQERPHQQTCVYTRNLQAAIGAYYDFESPNISVPSMSFVEDVTIGEGESIPPDTQFTKTWRIQNSGAEAWPPGVCLKYVGGDQFGHVNMVMVRSLEPQEIADVSVQMCSPSIAGMYQGQWRMCTATGLYYGDVIWVILSVEVGGLLGVTQQLSSFETEFNTQPHRKVEGNFNPFASPQKNRQPDENNLKDPGGSGLGTISKNTWAPAPDQIEQDQNGLSQNSVNLSPSSHSNNLSVVTYSKDLEIGFGINI